MKVDVHQHLWSEPLVEALSLRREFPYIARENALAVLYLRGERPYVIDLESEAPARRARLLSEDGVDRALLCLSSPAGIEWLAPKEAAPLLDAYHDGAFSAGEKFGVWGSIALRDPDPADVDRLLADGCVGLSLPAGAIGSVERLARMRAVLERLAEHDAPLLVHPGPGPGELSADHGEPALREPLWWSALTSYVASMHCAWLAFRAAGRADHPDLRVIFTMLAGLAPLQAERLQSRGDQERAAPDQLTFYEVSSYGSEAIGAVAAVVGEGQLLYGSDRPVVDPSALGTPSLLDWDAVGEASERALGQVFVSTRDGMLR
ncbi:MAG TPA: hypothetical protein VH025_10125 [Solirubrobacteraceae bacterium]|jgi:hypothetical protein|nr:hypothetical protein [Solirubrobacteraceae bacterium]